MTTLLLPSTGRVLVLRFALAACLLPCSASAQSDGSVTGQVINEATGNSLANAVVALAGSSNSVVTDRDGRFLLLRVPAGPQSLNVTYTGLNPRTVAITVTAGLNNVPQVALSSEIYKMDSFVVAGVREGNSLAIAAQRNAPNLKTIVATDAYGNLADGNLGEFLKRVPGIGVGDAVDEVTQVRVRGAAAEHTAVTMDGTRLPSPQAKGDGREFAIDQLPADFIERIEVIKAPTPDMDGDAIGGTVNLITKSAFDTQRRYLQYATGANYRTLGKMTSYFGSMQYSDVYGRERNLGMFLTASYSETDRPQDYLQLEYDQPAGVPNLRSFRLQPDYKGRKRTGAGLRFDYRLSANSSLSAGLMYNYYEAIDRRRRWTASINNNATGRLPGATSTDITLTAGQEQMQSQEILTDQQVFSLQVSGKHRLQSGSLRLDYGAAYAPAKSWEDQSLFQVRGQQNQRRTLSREPGGFFITTQLISGTDILSYNNARQVDFTYQPGRSSEDIWGAHLNAQKNLPTALPAYLKAGFRIRGQSRERSTDRWEAIYRSGANGPYDANRFKLTVGDRSSARLFGGRYLTLVVFGDAKAAVSHFFQNPAEWNFLAVDAVTRSMQENGEVSEMVSAGYLMGDVRAGRLGLLAGLRMEQTNISAESPKFIQIRPALPSSAPIDQQVARVRQEWAHSVKVKSDYQNWFPGLHARYGLTQGLLARASYSENIGRPPFGNLKPLTSISVAGLSVTQNNTALKPQESKNYDLSLEYYFEPVGVLSATVFKKEIKNFISSINTPLTAELAAQYDVERDYIGWDFRTQTNSGDGEINGFELAYNQNLGGVARWLRPISVMANFTKSKGKGRLEGVIPAIWNLGLVYEQRPWTFRIQMNHQDTYLQEANVDPFLRRFKMEQDNLDLSLQYRFRPWLNPFIDFQNVLGEKIQQTQVDGLYLPRTLIVIGKRINFGVKGRF
ncbi:MAG: TonB-dependent receptor [Verrucomicrobia bacterium]|nr:TonB-dependent receptor [Verrucomicrobiota bacterium]